MTLLLDRAPDVRQRRDRRVSPLAAALGGIAGAAVLLASRSGAGLTVDSGAYLGAADGLLTGHGLSTPFLSYSERWPEQVVPRTRTPLTQFPPGYPLLLAAGRLLTGLPLPAVARLLGALCLAGTVALAVVLVHRATGSRAWAALAGLLLVRPPLVLPSSRALSEGPALTLLLAAVALVLRLRERHRPSTLVALCAVVAAGSAVRFPSAVVALGCALALRVRPRAAAAVLVAGALPPVLWFLRNLLTGAPASGKALGWHWPSGGTWAQAADKWTAWLGPHDGPAQLLPLAGALVVVGLVVRARPHPALVRGALALAGLYAAFVLAVRTLLDANLSFGSRMLLPVLVLATVALAAAGPGLPAVSRRVVGGLALLVVASSATALVPALERFPDSPSAGYASASWRSSPGLQLAGALPATTVVVTNAPDPLWLRTGRGSLFLPLRADLFRGRENEAFPSQLDDLRAALTGRDAVVLFFDTPTTPGRVRRLDPEVARVLRLAPVRRVPDATLYRVGA